MHRQYKETDSITQTATRVRDGDANIDNAGRSLLALLPSWWVCSWMLTVPMELPSLSPVQLLGKLSGFAATTPALDHNGCDCRSTCEQRPMSDACDGLRSCVTSRTSRPAGPWHSVSRS